MAIIPGNWTAIFWIAAGVDHIAGQLISLGTVVDLTQEELIARGQDAKDFGPTRPDPTLMWDPATLDFVPPPNPTGMDISVFVGRFMPAEWRLAKNATNGLIRKFVFIVPNTRVIDVTSTQVQTLLQVMVNVGVLTQARADILGSTLPMKPSAVLPLAEEIPAPNPKVSLLNFAVMRFTNAEWSAFTVATATDDRALLFYDGLRSLELVPLNARVQGELNYLATIGVLTPQRAIEIGTL